MVGVCDLCFVGFVGCVLCGWLVLRDFDSDDLWWCSFCLRFCGRFGMVGYGVVLI